MEEKRGVIVRADGTKETVVWKEDTPYSIPLSDIIHKAVNGYFELVQLRTKNMEMYVNEDGMRLALDPNAFATSMYIEEVKVGVPPICGDVIFVGMSDANSGDNAGLTPLHISLLYDYKPFVSFAYVEDIPDSDLSDEPEHLDEMTLEKFLALEREDRLKDSLTIADVADVADEESEDD